MWRSWEEVRVVVQPYERKGKTIHVERERIGGILALGCRQKEEKRTEWQKYRREGDRRKRKKGRMRWEIRE